VPCQSRSPSGARTVLFSDDEQYFGPCRIKDLELRCDCSTCPFRMALFGHLTNAWGASPAAWQDSKCALGDGVLRGGGGNFVTRVHDTSRSCDYPSHALSPKRSTKNPSPFFSRPLIRGREAHIFAVRWTWKSDIHGFTPSHLPVFLCFAYIGTPFHFLCFVCLEPVPAGAVGIASQQVQAGGSARICTESSEIYL
jgi:hypothetical protein